MLGKSEPKPYPLHHEESAATRYCEKWYVGALLGKDLVTEGTVGAHRILSLNQHGLYYITEKFGGWDPNGVRKTPLKIWEHMGN